MLTHGQSARAPSGMLRSAPLLGGPRGLQLQPQADSVAPQITWDSPKAHPWGNPALHPPLRGPQICPSFVLRAQQPLRARPGVLGSSSFEENPVAPPGKIPSLRPPGKLCPHRMSGHRRVIHPETPCLCRPRTARGWVQGLCSAPACLCLSFPSCKTAGRTGWCVQALW